MDASIHDLTSLRLVAVYRSMRQKTGRVHAGRLLYEIYNHPGAISHPRDYGLSHAMEPTRGGSTCSVIPYRSKLGRRFVFKLSKQDWYDICSVIAERIAIAHLEVTAMGNLENGILSHLCAFGSLTVQRPHTNGSVKRNGAAGYLMSDAGEKSAWAAVREVGAGTDVMCDVILQIIVIWLDMACAEVPCANGDPSLTNFMMSDSTGDLVMIDIGHLVVGSGADRVSARLLAQDCEREMRVMPRDWWLPHTDGSKKRLVFGQAAEKPAGTKADDGVLYGLPYGSEVPYIAPAQGERMTCNAADGLALQFVINLMVYRRVHRYKNKDTAAFVEGLVDDETRKSLVGVLSQSRPLRDVFDRVSRGEPLTPVQLSQFGSEAEVAEHMYALSFSKRLLTAHSRARASARCAPWARIGWEWLRDRCAAEIDMKAWSERRVRLLTAHHNLTVARPGLQLCECPESKVS